MGHTPDQGNCPQYKCPLNRGWDLVIINQQIKYSSFILPQNLLQSTFQAAR